ncbi:hypothetical protein FQR65_LT01875 [Abscondita terminalis]|nr:hypothetical protein FQR65_LT01875 [Abscondita terminalis]
MLKMLVRSAAFVFIFVSVNSEIEYPEEEYCPAVNICRTPLLYDVHYRCASDKSCRPQGYKCCRSDCYIHKVCVVPVNKNGEKIQLPDDILEASTYVITEPTTEITTFEFTTTQHNITDDIFSTTNTDAEITVNVTNSTDADTEFFNQSSLNTKPIALTESPIEYVTDILIPTGKEWQFEGSGDFGDEKDKVSSTTTLLSTKNVDDIDGSGDDEVRDMDVDDGSGSGIGDDDDFDDGVKIEKVWEGSGLDVIDNEPDDDDDDEILTTYFPQIDDRNYSTTSKVSIVVNETHLNTTITDVIDIDYSYGSTLEELNSPLTSEVYENATFGLQENTTDQGLINVSTPNALAEEHQTETVIVEAMNATTATHLTVKESIIIPNTEETTANTSNTSPSNVTTYVEVTTTTPLNETSIYDQNYLLQNITTNEPKRENLGSTTSANTENLNSSTEVSTNNFTTTKPRTNEIAKEGSGDEFPDAESDDLDEEITTYVPIPLNKNYIRTKPNLTFTLAPDGGLGVTLAEDYDGDYDDYEVDEDIRNNFQTRITSG